MVQAPQYILDTIEHGYVMPFSSEPTAYAASNQKSALDNVVFVNQALTDLLADGRIKEVQSQPHVCNPLSVVENNTEKKRLVINLCHVNKFLCKQKFKYKDLRTAMLLFKKGDHMFTFDIKSG